MRITPLFVFKVVCISALLYLLVLTVLIVGRLKNDNVSKSSTTTPPQLLTESEPSNYPWTSNTSLVDPKVEAEMRDRLRILRSACARNGLDQPGDDVIHKPNPWEFLISKENHLVWCNVFKSDSSSWNFIFNQLAGYTPEELRKKKRTPPITLARKRYPRPSQAELEEASRSSVTFLVARHPFERLVSGFRDKILGAIKNSHHDKMRRFILLKYRGLPMKQYKSGKTLPTFKEFVQYMLDNADEGKEVDMHWVPVYKFCTPCQVSFTTIVKFETLSQDTEYILNITGIRNKVKLKAENVAKDGQPSSSFVATYLAELPHDLYQRLCDFYRYDFEIFGYDIPQLQPPASDQMDAS